MKSRKNLSVKMIPIIMLMTLSMSFSGFSQGRVVINEYLPWTSNGCGATAEFVELLNFGPGPMNIGCYIVTDGDYSITIPPNTIIQPGEFYVIAGQNVIPTPCANIDSTIHVNLNWNTCNCTSAPIPTTGDGFFTDGGSASEQVVLLSPLLTVVDAVVRTLPVEPSSFITTSSVGLQCAPKVFNLDLMGIVYETIGQSAGRGNSFARKLDGDCGWVKDPQQSAHSTNNTPSDVSDINYSFAVTNASTCSSTGSVSVVVNGPNLASIFPMNYTLAFDLNNNNVFELSDTYISGVAVAPNMFGILNLIPGNYRVTLASALGCGLKTFPFNIFTCGSVLPINLASFSVIRNNNDVDFRWSIHNPENLDKVVLEKSTDKQKFIAADSVSLPATIGSSWNARQSFQEPDQRMVYFRLRMVSKNGLETFSSVINTSSDVPATGKIWPNPVREQLFAELSFVKDELAHYYIFNTNNQLVVKGDKAVVKGINLFSIPVQHLTPGTYQLRVGNQNFRFVKL